MTSSTTWWGALVLALVGLAGCGSDSDGGSAPPNSPLAQSIAAAAADPANDTSVNPVAPFTVLQGASLPAVTIASPPKVNFVVFSDGAVKTGLTLADMSFAMAKLVPGANGNPAEWQNYVSREATATAPDSPGAAQRPPAKAMQATTDPERSPDELAAAGLGPQLVYNADGYYTYTFSADITDPLWNAIINNAAYSTNGVSFDPNATHRVAIQLSYTNAAGEVIRVNPRFDFKFVQNASGGYDSVLLGDYNTEDFRMTDVSSCNTCHEKLALHGGGRVDTQYCVMCHNPGTTDPDSGNVLTMSTMTHKIHAGRLLAQAPGGEDYVIWGYNNVKYDYAEIGYPQNLRNCAKCHNAQNPNTPQGDNWKSVPSQEACLTCHASNPRSAWDDYHLLVAQRFYGPRARAKDLTNADCLGCHAQGTDFGSDIVHWNQSVEHGGLYKMNIESVAFNDTADHKGRTVTVKYFLSDPTAGDAPYNLVTSDCGGTAATPVCSGDTKFGNLRFYLAYQNMVGQTATVTEFTSYNNDGGSASAYAYAGSNDGSNHYTVDIPLPDDTATAVAFGTARVISTGQIKEVKLNTTSAADPRPPAVPTTLIDVIVQQATQDVVISGTAQPRRQIVDNEKCAACHQSLAAASGFNDFTVALHAGARATVDTCTLCHDVNRFSSATVMTNGLQMSESFQFKQMIHGIHGNSKRTHPFTHGNLVIGSFGKDSLLGPAGGFRVGLVPTAPDSALFSPYAGDEFVEPGTSLEGIGVINYGAEVFWPGVGLNCNACHVNNSYLQDLGPLGAGVSKPIIDSAPLKKVDPDPYTWRVISPKAASCTGCHTSPLAIGHVTSFGNASFGDKTQRDWPQETCDDCHAGGLFMGVDRVHGLKP